MFSMTVLREFEWDENKNVINIEQHDIDFNDAWMIFENAMLRKMDTRKDYSEERWVALGKLRDIVVVIVYTFRQSKIRVISIRRANHHERKIYETYSQK
jgi:hypothetical protein